MENVEELLKKINKIVAQEQNEEFESGKVKNCMNYTIPYNSIAITAPKKGSNEIALTLENVVLAVKHRELNDGTIEKIFEVFNENAKRIIETDTNGKMKFDKEIMHELLKDKIKMIRGNGLEVAGLTVNEDGKARIESYFEMLGRKLVVMNKEQKERLDNSKDRAKVLKEISDENIDPEEDKDAIRKENQKEDERAKNNIARDTGIEASKITRVDDPIFYENNPGIVSRSAYAVLTKSGNLQIVSELNNKFEILDCFENSSDKAGRTKIIRNDDNKIDTKNTYGAIVPKAHSNMRYTAELGQYGELKLIEQIRYHGDVMEESDKYISREVQTDNTNFADRNLEGNENAKNVTARTFQQSRGYKEGKYYGNVENVGGISDIGKELKEHGDSVDFTMEATATDIGQRVDNAMELIKNEMEERSQEISSDEEEKIRNDLEEKLDKPDSIFCPEDAKEYCDEYIKEKEQSQEDDGPEILSPAERAHRKRFGY